MRQTNAKLMERGDRIVQMLLELEKVASLIRLQPAHGLTSNCNDIAFAVMETKRRAR